MEMTERTVFEVTASEPDEAQHTAQYHSCVQYRDQGCFESVLHTLFPLDSR
jgi:hypothetical protein